MSETSGRKPSVPFATYDPTTSSWRTSQASLLTGTLDEYSETWPKAGTMRSGTLLRLRKSERRTRGNASSSWPTPDSNTSTYSNGVYGPNLRERVGRWNTPRSIYGEHPGMTDERHLTGQAIGMWDTPKASADHQGPNQAYGDGKLQLAGQAAQWPTPQAADSERASETMMRGNPTLLGAARWETPKSRDTRPYSKAEEARHSPDLPTQASIVMIPYPQECLCQGYPTLMANDCHVHNYNPLHFELCKTDPDDNRSGHDCHCSLQAPTTEQPGHECSPKCRRLNPLFVEWLQGFPIEHTALRPSETP